MVKVMRGVVVLKIGVVERGARARDSQRDSPQVVANTTLVKLVLAVVVKVETHVVVKAVVVLVVVSFTKLSCMC